MAGEVSEAVCAAEAGADLIVAPVTEGRGHVGWMARSCKLLAPLPVIAVSPMAAGWPLPLEWTIVSGPGILGFSEAESPAEKGTGTGDCGASRARGGVQAPFTIRSFTIHGRPLACCAASPASCRCALCCT